MSLPIHIFLSGLIALAPDPAGTNQMTALLLDARNPPTNPDCPKCVDKHFPQLIIQTSDSDCSIAHCTLPGRNCVCDLDHDEISLQVQPTPASIPKPLSRKPPRSLPFDSGSALDFGYVANLSNLGATLNPVYRATPPPSNLVARMTFTFDSVVACSLATRRDDHDDNVHELSFRPLGAEESGNELMSQAVAQKVIATVDSAQQVVVKLTNFFTGTERILHLAPPAGATDISIELANERTEFAPDDPGEDGVGRDFELFYNLALPMSGGLPIPHVKYTRWKNSATVDHKLCHVGGKLPMSRPICPMASFNP